MLLDRLSIRSKLLLLSILPLLLLAAFIISQGDTLYKEKKSSYQTKFIIELALQLEYFSHEFAIERGLTEQFLASKGMMGRDQIREQRKISDRYFDDLEKFINSRQLDLSNLKGIQTKFYDLRELIKKRNDVRQKIDQLSEKNNGFSYYSLVNNKAIGLIDSITIFVENSNVRRELRHTVEIMWLEEHAGQSRGALHGVYQKRSATFANYTHIHTFINKFDHRLELLLNNRSFHTKADLNALTKTQAFKKVDKIQNNFLKQIDHLKNIQGPSPEHWFSLATQRSAAIDTILEKQALYTQHTAQQVAVESMRFLVIGSIIMIVSVMALISLSYYIAHNISARIHNINTLLTRSIDTNDLSTRIDEQGDDEVTHIAQGINHYISWLKEVVANVKEISLKHEHLANHDTLTNLPNRSLFYSRLTHLTDQLHRHDRHHAILYIDLDFFKRINDGYGHNIGDKVLQLFSKRLVNCIRQSDTPARLGGDEFAVILEEITSEKAQLVSQKILNAMKKPFLIYNFRLDISVSIGMTFFPDVEPQSPTELLQQADKALYDAKKSGRQQYRYFDNALKNAYAENQQLENDLETAIANQEILPHFQPQYCLRTKKIVGLEALARWQHPTRGFIPPVKFIAAAEKLSLITLLTESMIKQVASNLPALTEIDPELKVAINISGSECSNPHILHLIQELIKEKNISPKQIELEVTETMLIEHPESSIKILTTLSNLGISIAIDDFGTGYSSLSYLADLPIDVLKIDRRFVEGIGINPQQEVVVQVIIDLAKRLSLKVIAEGVETQAQAEFLAENGCDYGQGYFYSKPLPAHEIAQLFS